MNEPPQGRGRQYAFLCVGAGPLLMMLLAGLIFEWASPDAADTMATRTLLTAAPTAGTPSIRLHEIQARYAWLATVLLNVAVPILAIIAFANVARRTLSPRHRLAASAAAIVLCAGGIAWIFVSIATDSALHRMIFEFTFDALRESHRFPPAFLDRILLLIWIINGLAIIAPSCALVACVATVAPNRDLDDVPGLRLRARCLRETINAAGALLVSGILHMSVWLQWPAAWVVERDLREHIERLTLSVTVFWGLAFSLMIVSAFLPATLILRERALRLHALSEARAEDPEKWLEGQGLKFNFGSQLPQVAVMLAPLLAGPAASIFSSVAQWGG